MTELYVGQHMSADSIWIVPYSVGFVIESRNQLTDETIWYTGQNDSSPVRWCSDHHSAHFYQWASQAYEAAAQLCESGSHLYVYLTALPAMLSPFLNMSDVLEINRCFIKQMLEFRLNYRYKLCFGEIFIIFCGNAACPRPPLYEQDGLLWLHNEAPFGGPLHVVDARPILWEETINWTFVQNYRITDNPVAPQAEPIGWINRADQNLDQQGFPLARAVT